MREKNRNSIASCLKFPQFTTMHVIDGQAGLIICTSLIFYSLTIDNILNIIVLLILAGISISMLSGDNGTLQRATDAKTQTEMGQEKEIIALAYNSALAKKVSKDNLSDITDSELNDELDNSEATAFGNPIIVTFTKSGNSYEIDRNGIIKKSKFRNPNAVLKLAENKNIAFEENTELEDDYGNKITIPKGFKIISDSPSVVTAGIIIEDATYTNTIGSQFVWIPTGDVYTDINGSTTNIELCRCGFNASGEKVTVEDGYEYELTIVRASFPNTWTEAQKNQRISQLNGIIFTEEITYREGSKDDKINATAKELSTFISSVGSKGGFYIGRYEARTATQRTNSTLNDKTITDSNLTQITEKQSDYVYNYLTQLQAAKLSRDMYSKDNDNNNITEFASDLMNSYAWDTAVLFLQEFDDRTDTSTKYSLQTSLNNSLSATGTTTDKICNIYDMASNCFEWTTETSSRTDRPCVLRAGDFSNSYYYTSLRGDVSTTGGAEAASFRPVLYVK